MASKAEYLKRYLSAGPDDTKAKTASKSKKRKKGAIKIVEDNEDIEADLQRLRRIRREEEIAEQLELKQAEEARCKEVEEKRVQMRKQDGSGWTQIAVPLKAQSATVLKYGLNKRADLDAPEPVAQPAPSLQIESADLSPQRPRVEVDLSPERRPQSPDSPDLSPRRSRRDSSPRRQRHDSPDISPPGRRHDSPDISPPRRRHDSPDPLPPRRRHDSPDLSPPRMRHDSPDLSPPRRRQGSPSSAGPDLSPPRRGRSASPDLSPPRRRRHDSPSRSADRSPPRRPPANADLSPPRKAIVSQTVVRDAHGRAVDVEKAVAEQQRLEKEKEAKKAMFWSSGIVQEQEKAARQQKFEEVAATSFARTANDTAMNEDLRRQSRFGDPMQFLLDKQNREEAAKEREEHERKQSKKMEKKKKKLQKKLQKLGLDIDEELVEKTLKQEEELTVWTHRPVYEGPLWPNRYGIRPGYRWDGVFRTNKWEAERFKIEAKREASKVEAYHYSVEDM